MPDEPAAPLQYPADGNDPADQVCPTCQGCGKAFRKVFYDQRIEAPCPACGGSGRMADYAAGCLTGELLERQVELAKKVFEHTHGRDYGDGADPDLLLR